jgi:hypothetical protein
MWQAARGHQRASSFAWHFCLKGRRVAAVAYVDFWAADLHSALSALASQRELLVLMAVHKRASGIRCVVGGSMGGGGWLPAGDGGPLRQPVRVVTLTLEIKTEGPGFLLICTSDDPGIWADWWFSFEEEAASAAAKWFGARPGDWIDL